MTLQITCAIPKSAILVQEDPPLNLTLTNVGSVPLQVVHPSFSPARVTLLITSVDTGVETIHPSRAPEAPSRKAPVTLKPGETLRASLTLQQILRDDLLPGSYEIRVSMPFDASPVPAVSDPVRLKVLPSTPRALTTVNSFGGDSKRRYAAWVNVTADGARIVRGGIALTAGIPIYGVMDVADCPLQAKPVLSAPANRVVLRSHWIAWISGAEFFYTHVDQEAGATKPRSLSLPMRDAFIVEPMHGDEPTDDVDRPGGTAFLCAGGIAGAPCEIMPVQFSGGRAAASARSVIEGPRPDWITQFVRVDLPRILLYIQTGGDALRLYSAPWPSAAGGVLRSTMLHQWPGAFVAAAAIMDAENVIHGAILLRTPPDPVQRLKLVSWRLTTEGTVQAGDTFDIPIHPNTPVVYARVAVSDEGRAAALIRDGSGQLSVFDTDPEVGFVPAPAVAAMSKQPVELGFRDGTLDVLLICCQQAIGVKIVDLKGEELPRVRPK